MPAGLVQAGAPATGNPDTVSVTTGDFNEDLVPDLVVANQLSGTVSVFIGTGGGAYQAPLQLSATFAQSVGVGDFNQDGAPDIAVARTTGFSNRVRVFFGNGLGGFFDTRNFPAASGPTSLIVDDFNDDNLPDIAVAAAFAERVSVLLNTGTTCSTASHAAGRRLSYALYSRISKPALRSIR